MIEIAAAVIIVYKLSSIYLIFSGATEQPATDQAQSYSRAPGNHHKGNICTVQDKTTILILNIRLLVLDEMRKLHEAYQLCRKMMQNKRIRKSVNGRKMKNGKSKMQINKDL